LLDEPVFRELQAENKLAKAPLLEVLRVAPRGLLTVLGARFDDNAVFYVGLVFTLAYGAQHVNIMSTISLNGIFVGSVLQAILIPYFGARSDRIGRRWVYGGACFLGALFAFPFFWLVDSGARRTGLRCTALSLS
jgi:MFS transporter, MHS family, shikimate and dehydroshikimate transport protein